MDLFNTERINTISEMARRHEREIDKLRDEVFWMKNEIERIVEKTGIGKNGAGSGVVQPVAGCSGSYCGPKCCIPVIIVESEKYGCSACEYYKEIRMVEKGEIITKAFCPKVEKFNPERCEYFVKKK